MSRARRTKTATRLKVIAGSAVAASTVAGLVSFWSTPVGAVDAFTVQTLHFAVKVGPVGNEQNCDIIGDLYLPNGASATKRVPAILTTNGFGGSKDDQAGFAKTFATRGYAALSYSGLGFGGSGCKITLDDPDYDGRAGSQLVSYLGGASGIAFTDAAHTKPAPVLTSIVRDTVDHLGHASTNDPRVGMLGGSYGGGIQFAVASVDPRLDTIVPLITWNDLSYSLGPNNTAQTSGVSSSTPGAAKLNWGAAFSAYGVVGGVQQAQGDPNRLFGCPNFADWVCPALATATTTGFLQPDGVAALRHASVGSYVKKIRIPVLLIQGQNDTLFNLNEAAATYGALKAQGTPVRMIWQSWGHSGSTPAPGEVSLSSPDPATQYETLRVANWFEHYLKGKATDLGPNFSYFRDWVKYAGIATPAYASASAYPVGTRRSFYLSAGQTLVTNPLDLRVDSQQFVTPAAGAPTSIDPIDVIGAASSQVPPAPETDMPGTYATWTASALSTPLNVAGSPKLTVRLIAPTAAVTQAQGPAGQLVLFAKVLDVAPDGTASTIRGLVAPIRVPDVTRPVTVTLPGIVHQFAAGHRVRVVLSGASVNYRGGVVATPVTVAVGDTGQVLTLPVVP